MKKFLAVFALILLVPVWAGAVSDEEWNWASEMGQRWVEEHDKSLKDLVKKASELGVKAGGSLVVASKGFPEMEMKKLDPENASDYGIPDQVVTDQGVTVGLKKLYRTTVQFVPGGEHDLMTADYYDETDEFHVEDPTNSVSDLYIHVGDQYLPLFHGVGYHHCVRVGWLDQTDAAAPVFFEVGQYGGGSRVDKVLYTLDKDKMASIPDLLLNSPEKIHMADFIQKKLDWSVWLSGETFYRDLTGNGQLELVNVTRAPYPDDLKLKLEKKYGFVNTDFTRSFRKILSVYQWNDKKQALEDLGDFYY